MADLEDEIFFQCPYCMASISVPVDRTGGRSQSFTTDCEVCCRPIAVRLRMDSDGEIQFDADQES